MKQVSDAKFDEIHKRFNETHDTVIVLKNDIDTVKECIGDIKRQLEDFEIKLFKGNGHKSIMARLESIETKMAVIWAGVGATLCLVVETAFSYILK